MDNNQLAIEIYKRLLEADINASMASVPIIEEVLNEERERNITLRAIDEKRALAQSDNVSRPAVSRN